MTLAGFEITLFEEARFFSEKMEVISKCGGIKMTGEARKGFAKLNKMTTEIGDALKDAGIIIVAVVASRHERIAELCAPHLKDGQTILISPGNAGSLIFTNNLREKGVKNKITIAEVEGNLYSCRLIGPAEVLVGLPYFPKYLAAFPANDTVKVINEFKGIYEFLPATNVLETTLNGPNVVVHLPASLLNSGAIERSGGKFYMHNIGHTPSVLRCIEALHAEKLAVFKALGYVDHSPVEFIKKVANHEKFPELQKFRGLIGPTSMKHRYIEEDAAIGGCLLISLGEMLHISTPFAKALLTLASTINQVDYFREGRTIEKLGLTGLTINELNKFLSEGKK